jgi:hypothetical protein
MRYSLFGDWVGALILWMLALTILVPLYGIRVDFAFFEGGVRLADIIKSLFSMTGCRRSAGMGPMQQPVKCINEKEGFMKIKKLWLCLVVAPIALFFVASAGYAASGFDDKEIRIAQWGPQTGMAAAWGSVARGSSVLFNLVNEEGGIHGRKIKYIIRDDQYNPAQTKTVVKELLEKGGIFAFVGGVSGAGGMAVKDFLAQNKVIWVGPATALKEYVFPVNPYLFVTAQIPTGTYSHCADKLCGGRAKTRAEILS